MKQKKKKKGIRELNYSLFYLIKFTHDGFREQRNEKRREKKKRRQEGERSESRESKEKKEIGEEGKREGG